MLQVSEVAIEEDRRSDTQPHNDQERDEDVPLLDYVERVVEEVHLYTELRHDIGNGREIEEPAEEVEPPSVETEHAAIFGAGGDGRPVIDAAGGGDT